ncbi:MAG: phosphoglycerate kinase [Gammaproteobacteria bacterium]|nr:MAG: phosphoglycerate kinase [Gammaproteobacteria bacterium]
MVKMKRIDDFDYRAKRVLLRVDINSPIDPDTKLIVNDNRLQKSLPTIRKLLDKGAMLAIIAHQGDTLDYQNLIPLEEHAKKLSAYLGTEIGYIDDVAGPAAQERVKSLQPGEAVLLGNLRYLSEEISTFENAVKLKPDEMLETYLVRGLAPIIDYYVNDAFAAAHRNAPSMVAFQEIKPSAAGDLLFDEVSALTKVMASPEHPSVFVLGGAKISDAFGMMKQVLASGTADKILTCGITGEIMLLAKGYRLGKTKEKFLSDRGLDVFIADAEACLLEFGDRVEYPLDLAFAVDGIRHEVLIEDLPVEQMFMDIGAKTIEKYEQVINDAKTLFVNGPAGVYEDATFEAGTKAIWNAIAGAAGYSVIGGGDTVTAAAKFVNLDKIDYVCTAGGAMVRYLSGKKLPLIEAMEKAYRRDSA